MKKHYLFSSLFCLASIMPSFGQIDRNLISSEFEITRQNSPTLYGSVENLLSCPENTVLDAAFKETAGGQVGQMAIDQGREDFQSTFYQHFNGCQYKIDGLRFLATFSTFDGVSYWDPCTERGAVNENGEITKEIPLEIGFYKPGTGKKKRPGEVVYKKVISVLGKATGTNMGLFPIYSFEVDLGEEISLYDGYFSVTAVKEGEEPLSCWFSMLGSSTCPWDASILTTIQPGEEGEWTKSYIGACFCLLGNGTFIAQQATDLSRIISPISESNQMNEKVQVEIKNIGQQSIQNVDLELWYDGELLTTERVEDTILRDEALAYTFKQRVNCSDQKFHTLEIKNVTANLEDFGNKSIQTKIKPSNYPLSKGMYSEFNSSFISSIQIGDIQNLNTGNDGYHDYSDMKTGIRLNESLTLNITVDGDLTPQAFGVWVDWNNNKKFDDDFEEIALGNFTQGQNNTSVEIEIPKEAEIVAGDVRLRICASYGSAPIANDVYAIGETEDYTLTINRNDNSPIFTIDTKFIETKQNKGEQQKIAINLNNEGKNEMNGNIEVVYTLPNSPIITPILNQMKGHKPGNAEYVLKYDQGALDQIGFHGIQNTTYATYYPGEMLRHLKGMKIESVDVYVYDESANYTVIIYDENTRTSTGKKLTEQTFKAETYAWNTVKLDTPVEIGEKDLWVAVNFDGFQEGSFPIAIDKGTGIVGYGCLVNIGDGKWWTLPELGRNANVCIRANVGGTRSDAINWLALDKESYSINGGSQDALTATLSANNLQEETLYEAVIRITSNDEITKEVLIPVYMTCLKAVGIEEKVLSDEISLSYQDRTLTINSEKEVASVKVISTAGQQVATASDRIVNLTNVNDGIYIVMIKFADNSMTCIKLIVE